jgi:hypothetical protein
MLQARSVEERFWEKVDRRGDCWLWTGAQTAGYGVIRIGGARDDSRRAYAHRLAWELANGPIPDDMRILHRCQVQRCVNPAHLMLVSADVQVAELAEAGRERAQTDPAYNRGANNPHARLTDEQVREIRRRHAAGEGSRRLARAFGVSPSQVGRILRYESWAHVRTEVDSTAFPARAVGSLWKRSLSTSTKYGTAREL